MTRKTRNGEAKTFVLTLSDIVVTAGRTGEEELLIRGLDLRLSEGERLCIVYDNRRQAQMLADVVSGNRKPTNGQVVRDRANRESFQTTSVSPSRR